MLAFLPFRHVEVIPGARVRDASWPVPVAVITPNRLVRPTPRLICGATRGEPRTSRMCQRVIYCASRRVGFDRRSLIVDMRKSSKMSS